jgi:hypothetical protein
MSKSVFNVAWVADEPDEVKSKWCLLRAIEWVRLPLFVAQPIAPVALLAYDPVYVSICPHVLCQPLACKLLVHVRPPQMARCSRLWLLLSHSWQLCFFGLCRWLATRNIGSFVSSPRCADRGIAAAIRV